MANYPAHVEKELAFDGVIKKGDIGPRVRRVQEWLKINGFGTGIDSDFGDATKKCVTRFKDSKELPATGEVDQQTWDLLVDPLVKALAPLGFKPGTTLPEANLRVAEQHLAQHPIEVGGDNRGPWVRVYLDGNEGLSWRWCAGFVTFVMKQACMELGQQLPIPGSYSCDSLAYQAKQADLFIPGAELASGGVAWSDLGAAQIFLVRRTPTDWTHTGFSFEGANTVFSTIEGNTNEDGSANGFEVARRMRSVPKKDFIRLL
jgi:putative peptidoglycan binding protein